nr:MAG TPA_asm: hypothetical protein [Caudoviricetes sp.]
MKWPGVFRAFFIYEIVYFFFESLASLLSSLFALSAVPYLLSGQTCFDLLVLPSLQINLPFSQ